MSDVSKHSSRVREFLMNNRGAAALIFGLALLPMLAFVGAALDYTNAGIVRSRLSHVADRAALAGARAAAQKEADCLANPAGNNVANFRGSGCGKDEIAKVGAAAGVQFFGADPLVQKFGVAPHAELSNVKGAWEAQLSYSATMPTSIARLVGAPSIPIEGKSVALIAADQQTFLNFHLLLDRSMSMGIGATSEDIALLQSLIGCAFGCHTAGYASKYYDLPKAQGVRFRIDELREAAGALVAQAQASATGAEQPRIRMGVYAFNHKVEPLAELTQDLSKVAKAIRTLDLPTVDDGTQSADALSWLAANKIKGGGTGFSAASPLEIVFLVTDGVDDGIYTGWQGMAGPRGRPLPWWPRRITSAATGAFPVGACDALKQKGAIVAVVYTTYVPFPGTVQYDNLIGPFAANIEPNLKSCATEGYFFTASAPGDINKGMQHLFNRALQEIALRLTK